MTITKALLKLLATHDQLTRQVGCADRLLDAVRVMDLSGGGADVVTRPFADLGADVLEVEPPGGGPPVEASGVGRELGAEGLEAYRTPKTIYRTGSPSPSAPSVTLE